jgi:pyrophosphatase PpaX
MRRPLVVLFDLDGTLVDTTAFLLRSMRHAFEGYAGRAPTDAEWIAGIGTPLRTQLREILPDEPTVDALITRYRAFQHAHHDAMTFAFPEALDVVSQLRARGHPMGLVTSKGHELAMRTLQHVGLAPFMDPVVTADSVTRHKPDPAPVRFALDRLGVSPAEAIFVGDSPHDVNAGNAAGVRTVAALWGPFSREVLEQARPTFLLESLDKLPALVERVAWSA